MKQTAILGGTFDPIHIGHLIAGQSVYDTGLFDEICIMPSGNPPHKNATLDYNFHRLKMCELSIAGLTGFTVSDIELNRQGKIYTVDTFECLNAMYEDTKYWLIIGTDSLMNLYQWYEPERLLATVNFVVVDRGGYEIKTVQSKIKELDQNHKADFIHVQMPLIELSSSEIRKRLSEGKVIRHRVPDNINDYIMRHQLYL